MTEYPSTYFVFQEYDETEKIKANLCLVLLMNDLTICSWVSYVGRFAVVLRTIYVFQTCLSVTSRTEPA